MTLFGGDFGSPHRCSSLTLRTKPEAESHISCRVGALGSLLQARAELCGPRARKRAPERCGVRGIPFLAALAPDGKLARDLPQINSVS